MAGSEVSYTQPPYVSYVNPTSDEAINENISFVSARLVDVWTKVDLVNSSITLKGPNGAVSGKQTNDGIDTIKWEFTRLDSDGVYTIEVVPVDQLGNKPDDGMYVIAVTPVDKKGNAVKDELHFGFTYTTKAPSIVSTTPQDGAFLNTTLNSVSVVLKDNSGKELNWEGTNVEITRADGQLISGTVDKNYQNNTITLTFDNPFAIDGSDDGWYASRGKKNRFLTNS